MELSSILPNTDNFYKFLFLSGLILVIFSLMYPLEKKHQLDLEINTYNKQVEILNDEIVNLSKQVDHLSAFTKETKDNLEKVVKNSKSGTHEKILLIQEKYNSTFNDVKAKELEVRTKNIIMKYEKQRILILQSQADYFSNFQIAFFILGPIFLLIGLVGWYGCAKRLKKREQLEISKLEKDV